MTKNDSLFFRGSYQHRDPSSITFEAGNVLTNMPILESKLNTSSFVGGWTKILTPTMVNEFRTGYNNDNSKRQSNFKADQVRPVWARKRPSQVDALRVPVVHVHRRIARTARSTSWTPAGTSIAR